MLLEGGLTWQAMSMTPADMDFVALKAAAAREIALAFGVPPMLRGADAARHDRASARHDRASGDGGGAARRAARVGQCWIVGADATVDWSRHEGQLAGWAAGGWRFVSAEAGMTVWNMATGLWLHRDGAAWREGELPVARILVAGPQ